MKSKWIEYQARQILYIDLSNFRDDVEGFRVEIEASMQINGPEMYRQPLHSVLVLVDLSNTGLTRVTNKMLSDTITETKKYIARTAVVGMTGIRKIFLDYFGRLADSETASFDDPETAKHWLVGDESVQGGA
jgi:hypothetical protein